MDASARRRGCRLPEVDLYARPQPSQPRVRMSRPRCLQIIQGGAEMEVVACFFFFAGQVNTLKPILNKHSRSPHKAFTAVWAETILITQTSSDAEPKNDGIQDDDYYEDLSNSLAGS
ncbi:hypothetical protein CEXT_93461 [Caerostris extrusa]|uniref:Uncharacterized protein n=1 Tax=Caerostris extrusa TaxID=172846 RepID=A0AAV4U237_CAEEX|nr:hypothetical protein CEXT_93461 [Caerostris extrusa]